MAEKKNWAQKLVGLWKDEIVPNAGKAYDELGEAAKSMVPHFREAGAKIKEYSKKVGEEVKDGVHDAKEITHELTDKVRKKKEDEEHHTEEGGHAEDEVMEKSSEKVGAKKEVWSHDEKSANGD